MNPRIQDSGSDSGLRVSRMHDAGSDTGLRLRDALGEISPDRMSNISSASSRIQRNHQEGHGQRQVSLFPTFLIVLVLSCIVFLSNLENLWTKSRHFGN